MNNRIIGGLIIYVIVSLLMLVGAHILQTKESIIQEHNGAANDTENTAARLKDSKSPPPVPADRKFQLSGWVPYWAKIAGTASLQGTIGKFSEINPFAYGVNADGTLVDRMRIGEAPWQRLFADAKREDVRIVPTVLWADAAAMHGTFTDPARLDRNVRNIVAMLDANGFSGVDIDYEGKDIADRDAFSAFLGRLHEALAADGGKTLDCTVEARTQDDPPPGFSGTRAMSYANDYAALSANCDAVRIMAYDQVFQVHRSNMFTESGSAPSSPNADDRWVEETLRYALRFIAPEKLVLGVSTYGWEFGVERTDNGYRYTRIKSIGYPDALEEARSAGVTPTRTEGGELSFTYRSGDGERLVTVDDAESVRDRIDIARRLGLGGISLFKIDGAADPKLFDIVNGP